MLADWVFGGSEEILYFASVSSVKVKPSQHQESEGGREQTRGLRKRIGGMREKHREKHSAAAEAAEASRRLGAPRWREASGVEGIFLQPPTTAQQRLGSPRMGPCGVEVLPDKCNKWEEEQGSDDGGGFQVGRKDGREGGRKIEKQREGGRLWMMGGPGWG